MGLAPTGMGAVINIKEMAEAMVAGDMSHIQKKQDAKLTKVDTEISALGQLKSALSALQSSLTSLSNNSQFYKMKSSISDPNGFSATVTDQAKAGVYQIKVNALAQSQNLSSGYFASSATPVGNGAITINFGTYSTDLSSFTVNPDAAAITLTIEPGTDNLNNICDAINAKNADVTAYVIQDSQGARLSLTSKNTGEAYAMQVTSTIAALNYDPTTSTTALTQNMAAQNSEIEINGMKVDQNSNQLKDILTGISLNLKQAKTDQVISLTIENNQDQLVSSINEFVKQYNDSKTLLQTITGYDKEAKRAGYFQNDHQIEALKQKLDQLISDYMAGGTSNGKITSIKSLTDLGITICNDRKNKEKMGLLQIDKTKLDAAVANNYDTIGSLFTKTIKVTDPNIQLNSLDTKAPAGTYNIVLDEYTPGVSMTGTIGGIFAESKDGVHLTTGRGDLSTVTISVAGGGTGDRGQIIVHDGLAALMGNALESLIGKNGELKDREESLNNEKRTLAVNQTKIDARSAGLLNKYKKQWGAVDISLKKMQDTSEMLTKVLDNLPKIKLKS